MRTITAVALCLTLSLPAPASVRVDAVTATGDGARAWVFPGEYESHQAMWMLWPTYENKAGFPSTEVVSDMIHAMRTRTGQPANVSSSRSTAGCSA